VQRRNALPHEQLRSPRPICSDGLEASLGGLEASLGNLEASKRHSHSFHSRTGSFQTLVRNGEPAGHSFRLPDREVCAESCAVGEQMAGVKKQTRYAATST
jgi:hypothetical protein